MRFTKVRERMVKVIRGGGGGIVILASWKYIIVEMEKKIENSV